MEDDLIRMEAFSWLTEQNIKFGDVLPRKILEAGFLYKDHRITLIGPKGIWKPKNMELPISITTTPGSPYDDLKAQMKASYINIVEQIHIIQTTSA